MYDDWKITWREALFSVIIIAVLYGIGVWISNPILSSATEEAQRVITMTKVSDAEKFGYIRRTNVGNFLAEGDLIANDTITLSEFPGKYSRIKKVKEEYRSHTETYTTTDDDGDTHTHTRIVWEWEVVKTENFQTQTYTFLGTRFTGKEIDYSCPTTESKTIYDKKLWGTDVRYTYYTTPLVVSGTMRGVTENKAYKDLKFKRGTTIKEIIDKAERKQHNAPITFWVLWSIVIAGAVFLFVYCENDWLEDKKKNGYTS